ncbi:MAG: hypothetical protein HZB50_00855 [Chloroflexi bacterium]|nr:hypothetical protein [Chloroflexota bacterium]
MFDNLREEASKEFEEEAKFQPGFGASSSEPARPSNLFGMTPFQRFVIAFMLMIAVAVIGVMFLLVMGKIGF